MKKIIFIFVLLFSFELLSAKSDIQITTPIFTFCKYQEISGDNYKTETKNFYESEANWLEIKNTNLIGNSHFGFYESLMLCLNYLQVSDLEFGVQISIGGMYNFFSNDIVSLNIGAGPHIKIFKQGIVLGGEIDLHGKFTPNRRCSPVVGCVINCDFFTNHPGGYYETIYRTYSDEYFYHYSWESKYIGYSIKRYFDFYLQPYIAFCVNF